MPRAAVKPKTKTIKHDWPADRVTRLKVTDLAPYARNARLHSSAQVDQLAEAIKRFGFTNPVIVDERHEIIAGHGRVMAALRIGLDEVPGVIIAEGEWSDADIKAYRIWDNQSGLLSEWSPELLRIELTELRMDDYDLTLTGFDETSLVSFMANPNPIAPSEFGAVDEDIETEHSCPKCGYRWSGNSDAAGPAKK